MAYHHPAQSELLKNKYTHIKDILSRVSHRSTKQFLLSVSNIFLYVLFSEANELEKSDFGLWKEKIQRPLTSCIIYVKSEHIYLKCYHISGGLEYTYPCLLGYSTSSYVSSEVEPGLQTSWPGVSLVTSKAFTYSPVRKAEKPLQNI